MKIENLIAALRRLKVQTGSLACLVCGLEHDCGVHGCRILREAAAELEALKELAAMDIPAYQQVIPSDAKKPVKDLLKGH